MEKVKNVGTKSAFMPLKKLLVLLTPHHFSPKKKRKSVILTSQLYIYIYIYSNEYVCISFGSSFWNFVIEKDRKTTYRLLPCHNGEPTIFYKIMV